MARWPPQDFDASQFKMYVGDNPTRLSIFYYIIYPETLKKACLRNGFENVEFRPILKDPDYHSDDLGFWIKETNMYKLITFWTCTKKLE
mmetsp:Transcript_19821/g.14577  ORF Transcript_19821/g.14577 Transcript_19821/m.14577 type:complete len:89 (+) Transcript_19821:543-809(+)